MGRLWRQIKRRATTLAGTILCWVGGLKLLNKAANAFELVSREGSSGGFPHVRRCRTPNLQILLYHRVNDRDDSFLPATPTPTFKKQMEYLADNFHVLALEDAVGAMVSGDIPRNAVALTFDDGYRDNYLNAFPLLREMGLTATVFLATGSIGSDRLLWHDRVLRAIAETTREVLRGFGPGRVSYSLRTAVERRQARNSVLYLLRNLCEAERDQWIEYLLLELAVEAAETAPGLMLTWDHVRQMHRQGITFGAHTETHAILSKTSTNRARDEIVKSKKAIEHQLGTSIRTFAYPSGRIQDFNETTIQLVKEAEFSCAVTTIPGSNRRGESGNVRDLWELRRDVPWERNKALFATRLNLAKLTSILT